VRTIREIQQVSDHVWFVQGPASNWTVLRSDAGTYLIDAGYPADAPLVVESVAATGAAPDSVVALFVTHAHTDHIRSIPALLERLPSLEVLAADAEVDAVRGPEREQITVAKAGARLLSPRFATWVWRAVRAGGTQSVTIPSARGFTAADLDRAGIVAHPAPGHTQGSTVYEVPAARVLVTGDAFITDHPTYARPRAGAISAVFSADDAAARASAAALPRTHTILPGHGPVLAPRG
jgi:glyoxylase-like metal-dependent hydrolase (beta-lactamase superfamily II)